jgi:radical SAM superfamily enzyme YgiQ (UPF0313 family)
MDVLLVGAELEENLALRYLGASLRRSGHTPHYVKFDSAADTEGVIRAMQRVQPALIGLSMTFQYRAKEFGQLAQTLRERGYPGHITGGGHFPTFAYKEVLDLFPAIDTIVRHEGEQTIVELCHGTPLPSIHGIAFRDPDGKVVCNEPRALEMNLDALPFPERFGEPQLHLGIPAAFLVGTRGCFGHCTFCCIHAYLKAAGGPMYRMRTPANIADEMLALRKDRGARMFVFHDDDFFTRDKEHDLARMIALRDALRERRVNDIALVVKARPDDVDKDVFDVLEEIGLLRVYLGIEAGSTQGLRTLGRGVDMAQNRRALDYLRKKDIYVCFNMLVFDPESSLGALRESFRFLRDYTSVPMNFCRTEIYVGTPLMTKLEREKRLVGDVFGWDYAIRDPRADRAFRIFARAFLDRNFRCDGLMNSTLGLGYHLQLLRNFYPSAMSGRLRELVDSTTRAVNTDCIGKMESILDFAGSKRSDDPKALEEFTRCITEQVKHSNEQLEERVASATDEIVRAAFAPKQLRRVPAWQAAGTMALALVPLDACDRSAPPPPPDPLPVPTLVAGPPDADTTQMVVPNDPLPMPFDSGVPLVLDSGVKKAKDAGPPPPPPPDPLPPPTIRRLPPPPDPLPRPHTKP